MGAMTLDLIRLTPLRRITVAGGDVLHAMKSTDADFHKFGEAYFSMIQAGAIKAWKKHVRMTLNLVVPIGEVRFVFFSDDAGAPRIETIGPSNYCRLSVPPGVWFGMEGLATPFSLVLNLADIPHDPDEVINKPQTELPFTWGGQAKIR